MNESPLSPSDIQNCERAVYDCSCAEQEIARLEALGLDVSELKARCEQLKQFHTKVIELYKPLLPSNKKSRK